MEVKSKIGKLIDKSPYKRKYIQIHFNKSRNTISNWCTGKTYPIVPELFELARLLGVWVDDLYEEVKEHTDPLDEDIYELGINQRTYNSLKRNNINTIRDLLNCDLRSIRGLGPKSLETIESKIHMIIKDIEEIDKD
jgi:transcriptional regulator with XRE-family HTH domain